MGTELGTATFLIQDIRSLFPEWFRDPWMNVDVDDGQDAQVCFVWCSVGFVSGRATVGLNKFVGQRMATF